MNTKTILPIIASAGLLFTACGGGGDSIKDKDVIAIYHHYPKDICTSKKLKDSLVAQGNLENIKIEVKPSYTKCFDYDRYDSTCTETDMVDKSTDFLNFSEDCVIGADVSGARGRALNNPDKLDTFEVIENLAN